MFANRIWPTLTRASVAKKLVPPHPSWLALPCVWLRRLQTRHELSMLDAEQMRDTGLNPDMIKRESVKPFWVP